MRARARLDSVAGGTAAGQQESGQINHPTGVDANLCWPKTPSDQKGAPAASLGIAVRRVDDVTGDSLHDISFEEVICDDGGCRTIAYVLSSEEDGYRRAGEGLANE